MSEAAEADLVSIWCHVAAETSEAAATRFCERIRNTSRPLCYFPDSGSPRDEIVEGLRAAFCGRYVVYYVSDAQSVVVVRVLHGARDTAAIAAVGGFEA